MPTKPFNFETDSNGYGDVLRPEAGAVPPTLAADDMQSFGADGDLGTQAKEGLAERVASAKETLADTATTIADRARSTAAATDTYVRQSPWQAVGIGAAAGAVTGFVLGFLLARR
ncbi:MAG TPA: hypothetical protein VM240_11385 [Verrucomicrobiae bacterium]|nr:hypothetical protein [Verrucomicrobiae bacterium]